MKTFITILSCLLVVSSHAKNNACEQQATAISMIQGQAASSALVDQMVWVKGVVTADFRGKNRLGGYFIQSVQADQDENTSEGLFVQENNLEIPIQVGDWVALQGRVTEEFGVTQLSRAQKTQVCSSGQSLPEAVALSLPLGSFDLESVEGMYVTLAEPYIITDVYQFIQYGELKVSSKMLMNPTSLFRPGKAAKLISKANQRDQLIIDDGRMAKFPEPIGRIGQHAVNANQPIQVGQTLHATGVMHYAFDQYKLQITSEVKLGDKLASSQSMPQPTGGQFKIASFNVENFFTTLDNGQEICGPLKNFGCRGADNQAEYHRQLAKLVAVINTADASVVGLQELENNARESIQSLVKALNQAAGKVKWGFVDTGLLGEDVIKVGLIYQLDQLKPKGDFALLNRSADAEFVENKNRIIVAQTFEDLDGNAFNVATVHFKSKSCRDAEGIYLDQKDGQGCYNPTRVQVAKQLAKWLKSDPTGQQAAATFIVGDFNSYQKEDPMEQLKSDGFYNLANKYLSAKNWTTSYRGTVGSLDYVLVNQAARDLTTGLTQWHINSVAMDQFGYNLEPLAEQLPKPDDFYQADPYASSDHDVVIAGIQFK
jgi:predicted extracellular nuclease